MQKPDLFWGMNIGLMKVIPPPTKLYLFSFLNLPFTTPLSRLVQGENKTERECTVVHGTEIRFMNIICHRMQIFWGKIFFPLLTINEFLMQTSYMASSKNLAN